MDKTIQKEVVVRNKKFSLIYVFYLGKSFDRHQSFLHGECPFKKQVNLTQGAEKLF